MEVITINVLTIAARLADDTICWLPTWCGRCRSTRKLYIVTFSASLYQNVITKYCQTNYHWKTNFTWFCFSLGGSKCLHDGKAAGICERHVHGTQQSWEDQSDIHWLEHCHYFAKHHERYPRSTETLDTRMPPAEWVRQATVSQLQFYGCSSRRQRRQASCSSCSSILPRQLQS